MEADGSLWNDIWIQCGLRILLIWVVPICSIARHVPPGVIVMLLSTLAATSELLLSFWCRRYGKGKASRNPLPQRKFYALLAGVYFVQLCCLALGGYESEQADMDATDYVTSLSVVHASVGSNGFQLDPKPADLRWNPKTISVILPCAEERDYALKTVESVFQNTPSDVLHEIVVVDDGSEPPLAQTHLTPDIQQKYKVKLLRHPQTVGLIGAKKTGGDSATGDLLVFFDCHVAPQIGWYRSFLAQVGENYRRMVVPSITALDVNTWTQQGRGGGMAKCYLTWDADFKWFDSDDQYIAVISGGLLGMSKRWWHETGGYDPEMLGWGGENLDQSLRVWLCGGEIVMVADSQVAHMWRTSDPKTRARYQHVGNAWRNRARAAYGWYGDFTSKLQHYPNIRERPSHNEEHWYGNLSNFEQVKYNCAGARPFAWFLRRFRSLYEDAGMIPLEIFMLHEEKTGMCLRYMGSAGTSGNGYGQGELHMCDQDDHRFFWHLGNKKRKEGSCCSGLRAWNTDQCITQAVGGMVKTHVCDVSGRRPDQHWSLKDDLLTRGSSCIGTQSGETLVESPCVSFRSYGRPRWSMQEKKMPLETQLYWKAQREQPHLFGAMGVQHVAMQTPSLPKRCQGGTSHCVTVTLQDGSGRCFDEHLLLTSAKAFCSPFVLEQQTAAAASWQLQHASTEKTEKCVDDMDDEDPSTWIFKNCHGEETQRFEVAQDDKAKVCTFKKEAALACFELQPLQKPAT